MSKIAEAVAALAEPIAVKHDCELWDVEYIKEAGEWYLRVYIDRPDGVSIDHCEAISRELDPILDQQENLFPGSYTFEVSSAGAERQLRRPSDYQRFIGHLVEVNLYKSRNGDKSFLGILSGYQDGTLELDVSGELHTFEKSEVAATRLRITIND